MADNSDSEILEITDITPAQNDSQTRIETNTNTSDQNGQNGPNQPSDPQKQEQTSQLNKTLIDQIMADCNNFADQYIAENFEAQGKIAMEKGLQELIRKSEKQQEQMDNLELLIEKQDIEIEKEYEKLNFLEEKLKQKRVNVILKSDLKKSISSKNVENLLKEVDLIKQKNKICKVTNFSNSNRKTPDKSALLMKIPDEIVQFIKTYKALENIPVFYRKSDNNSEPWVDGNITIDRFRYGMDTMLVTDSKTQKNICVPYDSIAICSNQTLKRNSDLVKSLSLCQRIPKTDLDSDDLSDNAIVPLFRTHRVFVIPMKKSAWIISKVDDESFYVVYDDVYCLSREKSKIDDALKTAEVDAKIRHELEFNDRLYEDPGGSASGSPEDSKGIDSFSFTRKKSINGIDKVKVHQIIPIMGQLFFYDGSESMAIQDFSAHFKHLWNAPLMLTRIRKFDSQFNDQRKHTRWQQWYDNTYCLLVNSKKETEECLTFVYEHLNVHVGDRLELVSGDVVLVKEIDSFLVFFKVEFEVDGHEEWLHPVSVNLPVKIKNKELIWNEVDIEILTPKSDDSKTEKGPGVGPEVESVDEKATDETIKPDLMKSDSNSTSVTSLPKSDNEMKEENIELEMVSSQDSELDMQQDISNIDETIRLESCKKRKLVQSKHRERSKSSESDLNEDLDLDNERKPGEPGIHPFIYKKKTVRNKVDITMTNLPEILTNPLDVKLPKEFHNIGPLLFPLNFSRYYGNWTRNCYMKEAKEGDELELTNQQLIFKSLKLENMIRPNIIYKIMYTYNGHKIYNEQQLIPYLEDCNNQAYELFYNKHNKLTSAEEEIPLLNLENFSFKPEINTNAYMEPSPDMISVSDDVSKGTEALPIPAFVRSSEPLEHITAPNLIYTNRIVPSESAFKQLKLSLSKEMMPCCDCSDGCVNASTCQCIIRMNEIVAKRKKNKIKGDGDVKVGYKNRRLQELYIRPGICIIECGPNCHCMKVQKYNLPCGNRIVQCGIRQIMYLELMPTKGWGVRTKYDIPAGTFISTYSAKMYTSVEAEEVGKQFGDTFLCDLDYIEVAEKYKGELDHNILEESAYESGVSDVELESQASSQNSQSQPKEEAKEEVSSRPNSRGSNSSTSKAGGSASTSTSRSTRSNRNRNRSGLRSKEVIKEVTKQLNDPDESMDNLDDSPQNNQQQAGKGGSGAAPADITSIISKTRRWYLNQDQFQDETFRDEYCDKFVLDAMSHGNVGRFFNHSCDPNMAITNTFTYTQDMRFPVLAFFTIKTVRAGDELTWCYGESYHMEGPDVVTCACGAANCSKNITFKKSKFVEIPR